MTQFSTAKNLTNWDEGLGFIYANWPLSVSFNGCPYSIRETEKWPRICKTYVIKLSTGY